MKHQVNTKGKVPFLLIYVGIISFFVFAFAMRTTNKYGGELSNNLIGTSLFFPLILPVLVLPSWWILKKKVPISILVDADAVNLNYSKTMTRRLHKSKTAFSVHHYRFHSVIVFYSKMKATRGHLLHKSQTDLVGTKIPGSWSPKIVKELESDLIQNGFEKREIEDNKMFILRIMG